MNYSIQEDRLMDVMMNFFMERFPNFDFSTIRKWKSNKGSLGMGLRHSMHDFFEGVTYYIDSDKNVWFMEFNDDTDVFSDNKWDVSKKLKPLYDLFGEECFLKFVNNYFKINLANKGKKNQDWTFSEMDEVVVDYDSFAR